jgi:hypothetical protein
MPRALQLQEGLAKNKNSVKKKVLLASTQHMRTLVIFFRIVEFSFSVLHSNQLRKSVVRSSGNQ